MDITVAFTCPCYMYLDTWGNRENAPIINKHIYVTHVLLLKKKTLNWSCNYWHCMLCTFACSASKLTLHLYTSGIPFSWQYFWIWDWFVRYCVFCIVITWLIFNVSYGYTLSYYNYNCVWPYYIHVHSEMKGHLSYKKPLAGTRTYIFIQYKKQCASNNLVLSVVKDVPRLWFRASFPSWVRFMYCVKDL